ncbi:MAG TPA: bifunctional homocysteine S-methyltransferase/methylenetetrahydrofolate reductase [Sedimentisphaerales bacterium]|nr:bifunctional homocysteine S-methyltransferase/methylenetetrahydrofolate reductase [Sedimentisphaerales bacterium]
MAERNFEQLTASRVVIGDGAMGTMLYQSGVFLNACFDELSLSNPALVKRIHKGYVDAGSDIVETNTFGANEYKLARFGLAEQVEKINAAAAALAREASNGAAFVAGSIGPLGVELRDYSLITPDRASNAFMRQASALAEAGVDLFILETFSNIDELIAAIRALRRVAPLPIIAQLTVGENHQTIYGEHVSAAVTRVAAESGVTAVGINCSVGPSSMLDTLEIIRKLTDKPISVAPNAGMPRTVDNRTLYMCTPEYMAEYAKRFYELGARIIGGCCGTTPAHIKEIARAVRAMDKAAAASTAAIQVGPRHPVQVAERPPGKALAEKSSLGLKLAAGMHVTSIEISPPRGTDLRATIDKAKLCASLGVDCINIPDGPRATSRLSALITAAKIRQETCIEPVLHFCCRDRNLISMQSDMLGAAAIGLNNVLIITGDPPKLGDNPDATGVFDIDAIGMTRITANLNRGLDISGNVFSPSTAVTIGVGANPVAADLKRELARFEQKVAAGAEYAVTQPVFDPGMLLHFLKEIEPFRIPVIAGIWPFTSYKNAEFMANEVPGVVVPPVILQRMSTVSTKRESRAMGIRIAWEMMDAIGSHVAGFAVSAPLGNVKIALATLGKIDVSETGD